MSRCDHNPQHTTLCTTHPPQTASYRESIARSHPIPYQAIIALHMDTDLDQAIHIPIFGVYTIIELTTPRIQSAFSDRRCSQSAFYHFQILLLDLTLHSTFDTSLFSWRGFDPSICTVTSDSRMNPLKKKALLRKWISGLTKKCRSCVLDRIRWTTQEVRLSNSA